MYGLEKSVSLGFLENKELIQILIGTYQLVLRFNGDIVISIECKFDHFYGGHSILKTYALPKAASSLLGLIGQEIASAKNMGGGEIQLNFSNGETISIFDSNEGAESYEIEGPDLHLIV
jgi:hypothetical protein